MSLENIANKKLIQSYMAGWFHGFQLSLNVSVTFVPLLCSCISLIYSVCFYFIFFIFPISFIHPGESNRTKSNKISIELNQTLSNERVPVIAVRSSKEIEHNTFLSV